MKIVAIVQARMGSSRLPGKVLKKIFGKTAIELLLSRLNKSSHINEICVATSMGSENDILCDEVKQLGYKVFRGSETDVLCRFHEAATEISADIVVRITGDCPLVDPAIVDMVIKQFLNNDVDYVSNTNPPTFPDGLDVEVFSYQCLKKAHLKSQSQYEREHVTPFIRSRKFRLLNVVSNQDNSHYRITLDEKEDLELIQAIFDHFSPNIHFDYDEIIDYLNETPDLAEINGKIKRNEGGMMSNGQKLYKRAKSSIAGGTSLLSKRPEMFLPEFWPAYFSKAKGIKVWDTDGIEYLDMGLMGVGTNALGYAHPEVDDAVRSVIDNGNLSSLNCFEEVLLAEKLLEMNPWAGKVRFARTGGEANAMAVRLARVVAKNTNIAVCGYHGWHDWYLAANLGESENLDGHLMPGLDPTGVPRNLSGSIYTFEYNNYEALCSLVSNKNIGIIKMEVMRNNPPTNNFLKKVRNLADKENILLIFDECSSGFRETFGGLFQKFSVVPDLAVFGKTLGNGYAITAIIGKEQVMQSAEYSFISSTFWTERIGPAAALKALEVMEREQTWNKITEMGLAYREQLKNMSNDIGLEITISGIPALTQYSVTNDLQLFSKTYITQELLKNGILASTAFYPSSVHEAEHLEYFFKILKPILEKIEKIKRTGEPYEEYLDGPLCHNGFKRLN
jgi:glutamate-1-semialdehyde 2,1-aminomutase